MFISSDLFYNFKGSEARGRAETRNTTLLREYLSGNYKIEEDENKGNRRIFSNFQAGIDIKGEPLRSLLAYLFLCTPHSG